MRLSVLPALAAMCLVATACTDDVLTGPTAQEAFTEARSTTDSLPQNVVIYLDDVLVGQEVLATLDATLIQRIEIVKTPYARGAEPSPARIRETSNARPRVIRIYTKRAADGDAPTER
jgi:hypothetical protein